LGDGFGVAAGKTGMNVLIVKYDSGKVLWAATDMLSAQQTMLSSVSVDYAENRCAAGWAGRGGFLSKLTPLGIQQSLRSRSGRTARMRIVLRDFMHFLWNALCERQVLA
jgi:hypothetical protein